MDRGTWQLGSLDAQGVESSDAGHGSYTVEGDHLKRSLLTEFSPGQSNAIYDEYLSDAHRVQVQLAEVSP